MKVAIYSLVLDDATLSLVSRIIAFFTNHDAYIQVEKGLFSHFKDSKVTAFESHEELADDTDVFFAVGGDGTVLRSLHYVL